jgi:hypothetical protein
MSADELVLLKSGLPPEGVDFRDAAAADYVDRYFPTAAASLPLVRCVNLRSPRLDEMSWTAAKP